RCAPPRACPPLPLSLVLPRPRPPTPPLFPYTTLFRSSAAWPRRGRWSGGSFLLAPFCFGGAAAFGCFLGCLFAAVPALDHLIERSEEHTSELQSRFDLVCRLLLEKKKPDSAGLTLPPR